VRPVIAFLFILLAGCPAERSPVGSRDAGPAVLAPNDVSPPRKPPPLHATKLVAPALPDLPSLDAHEAAAAAPAGTDLGTGACRSVWTGSGAAPLACARALLFGGHKEDGATLLVPRTLLGRDPGVIPAMSDHRVEGSEGPVRDQGSAPACTAFATAAALDHALARWSGRGSAVSAMQIWSRYHSPSVQTSLSANLGQPIAPEQVWPFDVREAVAWVPCSDVPRGSRSPCGKPVSDPHIGTIAASSLGELTEVEYLDAPPDPRTLMAKIASGQDVIVAMELPPTFVPKGRPGARYIPHYRVSAGPGSGHALVLAGFARLPHGTYFLAHNSWGPAWGDGGYAWIHEATLTSWVREVVAVDAEPIVREANHRPQRARGTTTCAPGLSPDSIRATCSAPCPDASPRHDGVCAVAGQCPTNYVNLAGACVLAAPTAAGRDPSTGVAWACGPGGCAYTLPRSAATACSGETCMVSCPAPDFHVARMGSAIVCVE
jgi:hypothetical protein